MYGADIHSRNCVDRLNWMAHPFTYIDIDWRKKTLCIFSALRCKQWACCFIRHIWCSAIPLKVTAFTSLTNGTFFNRISKAKWNFGVIVYLNVLENLCSVNAIHRRTYIRIVYVYVWCGLKQKCFNGDMLLTPHCQDHKINDYASKISKCRKFTDLCQLRTKPNEYSSKWWISKKSNNKKIILPHLKLLRKYWVLRSNIRFENGMHEIYHLENA